MKRIVSLLVLAVLVFAADAAAQKDLARERISLQLKDVALGQVLPALAKSLGYELTLDPSLRALVDLEVQNVTAQTALNAICESVGCKWRVEGKRLIVDARTDIISVVNSNLKGPELFGYQVKGLDEKLPLDIAWAPADLYIAFTWLGRMYNADVDFTTPGLEHRKIAVNIKDATLRQAFDAVCAIASCKWEIVNNAVPPGARAYQRTIRVTERTPAEDARKIYGSKDPGITPPRVITLVRPTYTREAMKAKIQGEVKVSCVVEPDGSVDDVEVIGSLDAGLDEQAVKAVRESRFNPGTKDGKPVAVRVELEMTFTLR